jgi:tetrahydromethanopterin S-methyltransferase subunit G
MSDVQPADFETADYRSVLRRLTTLDEEAAGLRAEAVRWHDSRVAAAEEAVRQADLSLVAAEQAVSEAQRDLEEVDARAAGLWSEYVHKVGAVAERFGRTVPEAAIPRQRERAAADYLDEVATKVKYTAPVRPLTFGVKVLLGVFGFVGGLAGAMSFRVLRETGEARTGTWRDALPVVALVVLLACPVLSVVGAKKVADRRGVGLDAGTIATVLLTGLVTAGVVLASLSAA